MRAERLCVCSLSALSWSAAVVRAPRTAPGGANLLPAPDQPLDGPSRARHGPACSLLTLELGSPDGEVTGIGEPLGAWKLAVQMDSFTKFSLKNVQCVVSLKPLSSQLFELQTFWKTKPHPQHRMIVFSCCLVAKSSPTLCDPMDCSPSGSSVPGTLQARILEWVAMSFSRGSS